MDKQQKERTKIETKIIKAIIKKFKIKVKPKNFVKSELIKEYGINSIGIFESFILFENMFKIVIDEDDITVENFDCIDRIVDLISDKIHNKVR